jgi:hypothetical protein
VVIVAGPARTRAVALRWRAGTVAGAPRPSHFSEPPGEAAGVTDPPTAGTTRGSCRAVRSPR